MALDPSHQIVRRAALGRDAVVYSALNQIDDRVTNQERARLPYQFFGPYSTGQVSIGGGAEARFDLGIDPIAYNTGLNTPTKVMVEGSIIGVSGYYDWCHFSSSFAIAFNKLSWFVNNRGAGAAILYVNCCILAFF